MTQRSEAMLGVRGWPSLGAVIVFFFLVALLAANAEAFDIDAKSALLIDADTGQVLFEKNADEVREPASLTKIMTMLVAMDAVKAGEVSLDDPVRTSRRASATGGSQVYLAEGEVHSLRQMLKAIAIASANDASVAVAEFISGTEAAFAQRMMERARQLGMEHSRFYNADGLPPEPGEGTSVTTAREITIAARALIQEHPEVLEWTSTVMEDFRQQPHFILYNTNRLLRSYEGMDGLKTGHTNAAGWNLVATAKRGPIRLISTVLGADSQAAREERTRALLDYGFNRHVPVTVAEGAIGEIKMTAGNPENVPVVLTTPARVLTLRGDEATVTGQLEPLPNVAVPVQKGTPIADYVVYIGDAEVLRVPALADTDVARANWAVRLWRSVRDFVVRLFD